MEARDRWVSNTTTIPNIRYKQIRENFIKAINQSKSSEDFINYYDFLLAAKKLRFRFQQSSHLISVKNYFIRNRNMVSIKTISTLLCVNRDSLHHHSDKIVVKFNVPQQEIGIIHQAEESEDQKNDVEIDQLKNEKTIQPVKKTHRRFNTQGDHISNQETNDKIIVILSIKLEQMEKKLDWLLSQTNMNKISQFFKEQELITYDTFKKYILDAIAQSKKKVKFIQQDIKTLFMVICQANEIPANIKAQISFSDMLILKNRQYINQKLKDFYYARINRDMIEKTKFKLPRTKNSAIQIFHVKSALQLDLSSLEENIIQKANHSPMHINKQQKNKFPNFGPLRALSNKRQLIPKRKLQHVQQLAHSINTIIPHKIADLQFERQRINRLLKANRESKNKTKTSETIASKLRSLFIHKVILPRQKVLDFERQKYTKLTKTEIQLFAIKPFQ